MTEKYLMVTGAARDRKLAQLHLKGAIRRLEFAELGFDVVGNRELAELYFEQACDYETVAILKERIAKHM